MPIADLVGTAFRFHAPDFSVDAPGGYAPCRKCRLLVDLDLFTNESCKGSPSEAAPAPTGAPECALCGVRIDVDPMHQAIVQLFGSTCQSCFDFIETIGSAA